MVNVLPFLHMSGRYILLLAGCGQQIEHTNGYGVNILFVDLAAVMYEVNIALVFSSIKWYGHLIIYASYAFLYPMGWLNVIETSKYVG